MKIDTEMVESLSQLCPKDMLELIDTTSAAFLRSQLDQKEKIFLSVALMNHAITLMESVNGSAYTSFFHPMFKEPIEYLTGDEIGFGENFGL